MRRVPLLLLLACGGESEPEVTLADYGLDGWDGQTLSYAGGAVPYELATPLFSDYAVKRRAMVLPDGQSASVVDGDAALDFPVGTHLLKTFLMPADLRSPDEDLQILETRVLTRHADGWEAEPWLWNEEGTEASSAPSGAAMTLEVTGLDGQPLTVHYLVPQRNQCLDCHELKDGDDRLLVPIGPKVRHLNRPTSDGDQLQHLVALGVIDGLPADPEQATLAEELADPGSLDDATLDAAARDYLDINCAHCHNPDGTEGVSSQLFLHRGETERFNLGVCKRPGSAGAGTGGLTYDIVPGDHSQSILWFRMHTTDTGAMMPDIGRSVRHDSGVELIAEWIDRMTGTCD